MTDSQRKCQAHADDLQAWGGGQVGIILDWRAERPPNRVRYSSPHGYGEITHCIVLSLPTNIATMKKQFSAGYEGKLEAAVEVILNGAIDVRPKNHIRGVHCRAPSLLAW